MGNTAIEGIDGLCNGILHPLIVPARLLGLIALGLLTGQQGELQIQRVLPIFMVPLFVALLYAVLGGVLIVEQLLFMGHTLWISCCAEAIPISVDSLGLSGLRRTSNWSRFCSYGPGR